MAPRGSGVYKAHITTVSSGAVFRDRLMAVELLCESVTEFKLSNGYTRRYELDNMQRSGSVLFSQHTS